MIRARVKYLLLILQEYLRTQLPLVPCRYLKNKIMRLEEYFSEKMEDEFDDNELFLLLEDIIEEINSFKPPNLSEARAVTDIVRYTQKQLKNSN